VAAAVGAAGKMRQERPLADEEQIVALETFGQSYADYRRQSSTL
jgi:hypothetical protein